MCNNTQYGISTCTFLVQYTHYYGTINKIILYNRFSGVGVAIYFRKVRVIDEYGGRQISTGKAH